MITRILQATVAMVGARPTGAHPRCLDKMGAVEQTGEKFKHAVEDVAKKSLLFLLL